MIDSQRSTSRVLEIFRVFLVLGLTSFGGPVAHLGYFHRAFVEQRRWLNERDYADLVALCQFLPGPASSQVGFSIGLLRGGLPGAVAAWVAFTLPSAIVLVLFAWGAAVFGGGLGQSIIHGLKIVAVVIVAHAVWTMGKRLCPDRQRIGIALAAVFLVAVFEGILVQPLTILTGAAAGAFLCRADGKTSDQVASFPIGRSMSRLALAAFVLLLLALPLLARIDSLVLSVADAFYRVGALVFGGGHVVLPLLQAEVVQPGWVAESDFLAGYGLAQAIPGPLFTFSAYLGTVMSSGGHGLFLAGLALIMIFLPGMLLVVGVMPHWDRLRSSPTAQTLMQGANAAVVGVLGAALYDPVWQSAVVETTDFALALTGFLLLTVWRWPVWLIVIVVTLGSIALGLIG